MSSESLLIWAEVISRKHLGEFTSEISPCYENDIKSWIVFIWDKTFLVSILKNLLSTGDYAVFYPVLMYVINQLFHPLSSYMAYSQLEANAPRRLSAHIRLEFVE